MSTQNDISATNVRLGHLEDGQKEFKDRVSDIEKDIMSIKMTQSSDSNTLKRIESLLKWVSGGIFISLFTAIGKFIISGKLAQ